MSNEEKISVVLPCFNENSAIEKTIDDIKFLLEPILSEIVVVDDGSTDGTYQVLKKRNDIKLLRNSYNKGYGFSLKKGILSAQSDIIAITDADGTYPIEEILLMVKKLEEGFDLIIGKRDNLQSFDPFLKKISRFLFKLIAEFVAGEKILDVNSGLRVFRKSVISKYFVNTSSGFSFSLSTTLIYILEGLAVYYHPIKYRERIGESKVKYLRDILRSAQILVETIALYNPIKIFMLFALKISGFGFLLLLISFLFGVVNSSLAITGFFILQGLAVFTFSLGLICLLLKKRIFADR